MCMKKRWRATACFFLCSALAICLAEAGAVRQAAADALSLCARSVVPATFPFLVVSAWLVKLGFGELAAPWLAGLMEPLFRVSGAGSSALLLGMTAGYPIGAGAAAELYREGSLSRSEAERLLTFCNTGNPVFFISVLGSGVFGSVRTGLYLWLIHLLSALLTGLLLRGRGGSGRLRQSLRTQPFRAVSLAGSFVAAVRSALTTQVNVCAFVTFFYVAARPLAAAGGPFSTVLVGLTELYSLVPLLAADRFSFVLASVMTAWGGLSVLCQTAAVLEDSGLPLAPCLRGKLVQSLLSGALAALLCGRVIS